MHLILDVLGGGYPPQTPLDTPRGTRVDFSSIFVDFRVSFGRPWGTPGLPFPSLHRPGAAPGSPKSGKKADRAAKPVQGGILDGFGTAPDLVFVVKT